MHEGDRPPPPEYLTVAQVAAELQLSAQVVKQCIARGDLPATRAHDRRGKPWLVERGMLERWIRDQYVQTDAWRKANPRGGDGMWDQGSGGSHR